MWFPDAYFQACMVFLVLPLPCGGFSAYSVYTCKVVSRHLNNPFKLFRKVHQYLVRGRLWDGLSWSISEAVIPSIVTWADLQQKQPLLARFWTLILHCKFVDFPAYCQVKLSQWVLLFKFEPLLLMCAGLVLTEVQVEYQAPITVLFLLSSLNYFFPPRFFRNCLPLGLTVLILSFIKQ